MNTYLVIYSVLLTTYVIYNKLSKISENIDRMPPGEQCPVPPGEQCPCCSEYTSRR